MLVPQLIAVHRVELESKLTERSLGDVGLSPQCGEGVAPLERSATNGETIDRGVDLLESEELVGSRHSTAKTSPCRLAGALYP